MKILNSKFISTKMVTLVAIFLSACSGHNHHEQNDQPVVTTGILPGEVKVFENVDPSVKTQINGFIKEYIAMTNALIEDHVDQAKIEAKILSEDIRKFDMSKLRDDQMDFYHGQSAKLSAALKNIEQITDIEKVRMELATVSESIYALVKAYGANQAELYYNFCPMAKNEEGAYWLSEIQEIKNPYMGQRMLTCGIRKETIN